MFMNMGTLPKWPEHNLSDEARDHVQPSPSRSLGQSPAKELPEAQVHEQQLCSKLNFL